MKRIAALFAAVVCCVAATPEVDKGKIIGVPTAPIRIDIFSDFECPACKNFHETLLPQIVKDYVMSGKAYVVNREFPLPIAAHKFSREEANYATAAARLGIYQPVADALFKNQAAVIAGANPWDTVASVLSPDQQKRVQALAKDPAVLAEVQRDVDAGNKERVSSTPTIIVTHGTQHFPLPYPINYSFLRSLLDGFLK
jgi:protein-disulfide isomerase